MYDVVVIGGSLPSIISAIELSSKYKICIVDINQEIGFPTNFPGIIKNIDKIKSLFIDAEDSKLYLKNNPGKGWGLRPEWLIKYLTHLAAKKGVEILNRTKVVDVYFDSQLNIELIGGGPQNQIIQTKTIIDESDKINLGPGNKNHTVSIDHPNIIKNHISSKNFFVGTTLSTNTPIIKDSNLSINRDDHLTEFWFLEEPKKEFKSLWIEIKTIQATFLDKIMIIDDYFIQSSDLVSKTKNKLSQ